MNYKIIFGDSIPMLVDAVGREIKKWYMPIWWVSSDKNGWYLQSVIKN